MIEVKNLSSKLGEFQLKNIDLVVSDHEYLVLLGPTGSGKTVFIQYVIGMLKPDSGAILIDGKDVTQLYPEDRNIGYVPQDYALFPNMTVYKNIAYGLELRKKTPAIIEKTVMEMMESLAITHLKHRMPFNLSGGEKQRVALARTLVTEPKVILLDEPLSAVDECRRTEMAEQLRAIQQKSKATFIHVCHNFEEASDVADKIAIIHKGELIQTGTMEDIKNHPSSVFVAKFLKTMNLFNAQMDGTKLRVKNLSMESALSGQGRVVIGIRPENIHICHEIVEKNCFSGTIREIQAKPHFQRLTVDIGVQLVMYYNGKTRYRQGDHVHVEIEEEHILIIPPEQEKGLNASSSDAELQAAIEDEYLLDGQEA